MEKFTKIKPKTDQDTSKDDVLFSNGYMKLINYEDVVLIKESDFVVCIPYLIEYNQIILRHEYIPTFKYTDGQEYHITVISGAIESGETPEMALLRELEEEAGLVLSPDFKFDFMKPVFISKSNSSKYHPCLINLTERDYHEVVAKGDGSRLEKLSKSVKVDLKHLPSINPSDLITSYMLDKIKEFTNLK